MNRNAFRVWKVKLTSVYDVLYYATLEYVASQKLTINVASWCTYNLWKHALVVVATLAVKWPLTG